jgi:hypothetical protein
VAVSTGGTAVSQAQAVAKAVCDCLRTGSGVAEAVAQAASSGNANTAAQAIAEAASGGESVSWLLPAHGPTCRMAQHSTRMQACCADQKSSTVLMWACMQDVSTDSLSCACCYPAVHLLPAGVAQANAQAVAEAVYEALTCNCACAQPTATALAQAAARAEGGNCGGVAQSLAGGCDLRYTSMFLQVAGQHTLDGNLPTALWALALRVGNSMSC